MNHIFFFFFESHFLISRIVRKFGFDMVSSLVPKNDVTTHKRLKNLRKLQERRKKVTVHQKILNLIKFIKLDPDHRSGCEQSHCSYNLSVLRIISKNSSFWQVLFLTYSSKLLTLTFGQFLVKCLFRSPLKTIHHSIIGLLLTI